MPLMTTQPSGDYFWKMCYYWLDVVILRKCNWIQVMTRLVSPSPFPPHCVCITYEIIFLAEALEVEEMKLNKYLSLVVLN